jgi:hypothetical protein
MGLLILQLNCKAATPVKADRCAHFSPASYKGRSAPMQSTSQSVTICASATRQSDPFKLTPGNPLFFIRGESDGAQGAVDQAPPQSPIVLRTADQLGDQIFAARHVLVHIRLRASCPVTVNPVPPFPTLPSGMNRTVQYHWPFCGPPKTL